MHALAAWCQVVTKPPRTRPRLEVVPPREGMEQLFVHGRLPCERAFDRIGALFVEIGTRNRSLDGSLFRLERLDSRRQRLQLLAFTVREFLRDCRIRTGP